MCYILGKWAYVCLFLSHQAAAKQRRSSVEHEPLQIQDSPPEQSAVVNKDYTPQGITEPTSSEESLKEITPTTPRVVIQQPASVAMVSKIEPQHAGVSNDQYVVDTSLARPGPSGVDNEGEELVPSPRKKKKRKVRIDEELNTGTGNDEDYELVEVVTKDGTQEHVLSRQDNVDAAIPKKKKKKKVKSSAPDSLPPVIVRRPLPQLQLED